MRRIVVSFVVVSALLLALPVVTQEEPSTVSRLYFLKPKPGTALELEEALKRHNAWHRKQNDTWAWYTWEIETGGRFGQYVVGTFEHRWEDFDARADFAKADRADAIANQGQYVQSVTSSVWVYLPDLSRPPEGGGPASGIGVYVHLKNRAVVGDYLNAVRKIQQAIEKTNWPRYYYRHRVVDSGEQPTFFRGALRNNWADFESPDKPFFAMLEEVYGEVEAEAIWRTLSKTIHCERREIWHYRPDLSYIPGQ